MPNKNKEYAKLLQLVNNCNNSKSGLIQYLALNLKKNIVECRQNLNICEKKGYVIAEHKGTHSAINYKVTEKGLSMIKSVMPNNMMYDDNDGISVALGITESKTNNVAKKKPTPIINGTTIPKCEPKDDISLLQEQVLSLKEGQQRMLEMLMQTVEMCSSLSIHKSKPQPNFIKLEEIENNVLAYGYIYGTYDIRNKSMYIGQSKKLDRYSLENYKGSGIYISKELKERPNDFKKYILRVCYNQQELDKWEVILIEYYKSRNPNNGYNEQIGGTDRIESIHFAKQIGVMVDDAQTIKQIHLEQTSKEKQYRNETKS